MRLIIDKKLLLKAFYLIMKFFLSFVAFYGWFSVSLPGAEA